MPEQFPRLAAGILQRVSEDWELVEAAFIRNHLSDPSHPPLMPRQYALIRTLEPGRRTEDVAKEVTQKLAPHTFRPSRGAAFLPPTQPFSTTRCWRRRQRWPSFHKR
jgi:hypothetical protein